MTQFWCNPEDLDEALGAFSHLGAVISDPRHPAGRVTCRPGLDATPLELAHADLVFGRLMRRGTYL